MADLLSDEEVFGPKPKLLSDADAGLDADYYRAPRAQAPSRFTMGGILANPGRQIPQVLDFIREKAGDALQHRSIPGVAASAAADALSRGQDITYERSLGRTQEQAEATADALKAQRLDREKAAVPRPAQGALENVLGFGAEVGGTAIAPESMIAAPAKWFGKVASPVLQRVLRGGAGGAIGNTVTDPVVQGGQVARDFQDKYNVGQTLMAPVVGFAAGSALSGAGEAVRFGGEVARAGEEIARAPIGTGVARDWEPRETEKPDAIAAGQPVTVDDVWGRLIKQESGGKQKATSPKGARGVAQLMPDTAREVAEGLGKPELADLALSNAPGSAAANEILGKTYLNQQLVTFDGDPVLALAAYNAGPSRVQEWIKTFGHPDQVGRARWLAMVPFKETRGYVHAILGDVTGAPHDLTPADQAYMRGRMDTFPDDEEVPIPAIERAMDSADDAANLRKVSTPNVETAGGQIVAGRDYELTGGVQTIGGIQYVETDWTGAGGSGRAWMPISGPDAVPELRAAAERNGFLGGEEPVDLAPTGETRDAMPWDDEDVADVGDGIPAGQDLTDQALDQMRSGKPMRMGEGPSLIEALVKKGGLRDESGELTGLLGGEGDGRLLKMLRRVNTGTPLDDATLWAWQHGYIGRPSGDQDGSFAGGDRPEPGELLEALRRELAGEKIYPADRVNEHARALKEHMEDLDEMLQHLNVRLETATNAEIKAAMDKFWSQSEELEPGWAGMMDTGKVLGLEPVGAPAAFSGKPRPSRMVAGEPSQGNLGRHADRLYREVGLDDLELYLPNGQAANLTKMSGAHFMADTPDLAKGQGDGQGVLLEFDPEGLTGAIHAGKPGLEFSRGAGLGSEYVAKLNAPSAYKRALVGFRIAKDAASQSWAVGKRLPRFLKSLEQRGWVRSDGPDYVQYERSPQASPAAAAREAAQRVRWRQEVMASTRSGMLHGARSPSAIPAPRDAAGNVDLSGVQRVRGVPEIVKRLGNALGYPVRQGRLQLKRALGTYSRGSGVVRSKGRYDLNVLSHEFAHALEFTDGHGLPSLVAAMKRHTRALKDMDYNPKARRRHEGFAEWVRWYVTNPDYLKTRPGAEAFRVEFEAALAKDSPKTLAAIKEAQADYQAYLNAPSLVATREHVISPPKKGAIANMMRLGAEKGPWGAAKELSDEVYRGVVDFLHPWKKAVETLLDRVEEVHGVRPQIAAVADPYKLLRSMAGVAASGHMDLLHGVHGYHSLEAEGPSFVQALTTALGDKFFKWDEQAIADFGTYLVGRRVIGLYDGIGTPRGLEQPPDNLSREAWAQTVEDMDAANPSFSEAADMLYEWNNNLWAKRRDAGFLTEDQYLAGLEDHPEYVPLFRDISDKEFGGDVGGTKSDGTKNAGGVLRLKGSDRAYINPLHSMMNMAYELNAQIARNDALQALDDLGQLIGPDSGRVVERIKPNEIKGTETSVEEVIANAASQYGVSRRDAQVVTDAVRELFGTYDDDPMGAHIYRSKATGEKGEPIVYVWREGERIPLRLPDGQWGKHMVEGLSGMTKTQRSLFVDIAAIPARVLRAGVTSHPAFFLANSFRDQMTAFVLTNVGYRPFYDQAKGLIHEASNLGTTPDELSRIYNVVGGEIGGYQTAAEHAAHAERNIQALNQKGRNIRHFASPAGFARFTELSETGTRLGIFERALQDAKKRGFDDYAAAKEASFEARDYMDFDRKGGYAGMNAASRIVPFLNASLQALDKARRVGFGSNPAKVIPSLFGGPPASEGEQRAFNHALKLWSTATALGIAGLSLRAAYADDPEYQEVADYLRNTHWAVKLPDGNYLGIPKPYEIAVLSNLMERGFELAALNDPSAWKRLAHGLEETFIPAHDPAAFMPWIQVARNRDAFGSPIVPDYMTTGDTKREPRDQYTDRTSDISKAIGDALNLSPAQIDHVVKGMGGSWARDILETFSDRAPMSFDASDAPVLRRFVKDWTRGATSSKEFWGLISGSDGKWTGAVGSLNFLINDGKYEEAADRLEKMKPQERAYAMVALFAKGDDEEITAGEAKQTHPLARAEKASRAIGGLASALMEGNVRGPDMKPIEITPTERREAIKALHKMSVAEHRNALIAARVPGWEQKEPLPFVSYVQEFRKAAPQLVPALEARWEGEQVAETAEAWQQLRPALEAKQPREALIQMMYAKRFPTKKSGDPNAAAIKRALQDVAPVP